MTFESLKEAQQQLEVVYKEWRKESKYDKTGILLGEYLTLETAIVDQYGTPDPKYPNCPACKRFSAIPYNPPYDPTHKGPSHEGSPNCESGSIASGGLIPHCTCDACY